MFIWLDFPVLVTGNRRGTGTWKFHVLTHILAREDEWLSGGCQDLGGGGEHFSCHWITRRQTLSSSWRTRGREGNQRHSPWAYYKPSLISLLPLCVCFSGTACTSPGCTANVSEWGTSLKNLDGSKSPPRNSCAWRHCSSSALVSAQRGRECPWGLRNSEKSCFFH